MKNKKIPLGKISPELLETIILPKLGLKNPNVIIPPKTGFDAGVFKINEDLLEVVAIDPVLGVPLEYFGFFIFHFSASDVAVFGAKPKYLSYTLLFPPDSSSKLLRTIVNQIDVECKKYGCYVIGGHTGSYLGMSSPIAVSNVIGFVDRSHLVTPSGAKPGDKIIVTKKIGIEFIIMALYSNLKDKLEDVISKKKSEILKREIETLTVVPEALILAENKLANAMHDITEGGLSTALPEMANSSNVGFKIYEELIPVHEETIMAIDALSLPLLALSSTGSLLVAVPPENVDLAILKLKHAGILATVIGEFISNPAKRVLVRNKLEQKFPEFLPDPYAELLEF